MRRKNHYFKALWAFLASLPALLAVSRYVTLTSADKSRKIHLIGAVHDGPEQTLENLQEAPDIVVGQWLALAHIAKQTSSGSYFTELPNYCEHVVKRPAHLFGTEALLCRYFTYYGDGRQTDSQGLENPLGQYVVLQHYLLRPDLLNDWQLSGKYRYISEFEASWAMKYPMLTQKLLFPLHDLFYGKWLSLAAWQMSYFFSKTLRQTIGHGGNLIVSSAMLLGSGKMYQVFLKRIHQNVARYNDQRKKENLEILPKLVGDLYHNQTLQDDAAQLSDFYGVAVYRDTNMARQILKTLQGTAEPEPTWLEATLQSWEDWLCSRSSLANLLSSRQPKPVHEVTAYTYQKSEALLREKGLLPLGGLQGPPYAESCDAASDEVQQDLVVIGAIHLPGILSFVAQNQPEVEILEHDMKQIVQQQSCPYSSRALKKSPRY